MGYRKALRRLHSRLGTTHPRGMTSMTGNACSSAVGLRPVATAVTAFNDHCAAGLLAAVRGASVEVPGSLSIVGYDNSSIANLNTVALTTVAQDSAALARLALERAIGWAEGTRGEPGDTVVPPHLVVRSTTSRARP